MSAVIAGTTAPVSFAAVATSKEPFTRVTFGTRLVPPAGLCAEATGADATDSIPANNAVVAVSAIRLRSVVFDIFFLSLVRVRNCLILARRSFGSSNSMSSWHTRVMPPGDGNLFIR